MGESSVTADAMMRLLLIDGSGSLGHALRDSLGAEGQEPPVIVDLNTGRAALDLLRSSSFDMVAADLDTLADLDAAVEQRISRLARAAKGALLLILAEDCSISFSLEAMRAGAHDCAARASSGADIAGRIGALARRHGRTRMVPPLATTTPPAQSTEAPAPSIPDMRDLVLPMWRQEQKIIETAIQTFSGNITMAAAALELSPSTIYRKRQAWAEMDSRRAEMASVRA